MQFRCFRDRSFPIYSFLLMLGLIFALLAGCQPYLTAQPTQTTTASNPDNRIIGQWTNSADRISVSLIGAGKPTGAVTIGEWYEFRADGTYFHVARYMTFAIGGVMVEEGRFASILDQKNPELVQIRLINRTDSFFPDPGSPQKAKDREPIADSDLTGQVVQEGSETVLKLQSGPEQPWVDFYRLK